MTDNRDKELHQAAHSRSKALPHDDIDDLFDYDVGLDEVLGDVTAKPQAANVDTHKLSATAASGEDLGLDEEVKVSKKRQPIAKLDETCLLSRRGIPKLRSSAKAKLKFKGKGHEFQDAARLLNFYQLWLDDLFPRAKFADGLAMIERLGHSKRIQVMRREWIDEEKRKIYEGDKESHSLDRNLKVLQPSLDNAMTNSNNHIQTVPQSEVNVFDNRDDLPTASSASSLDGAFSAEERPSCEGSSRKDEKFFLGHGGDRKDTENGIVTEDDDLEALLAEQEGSNLESARDPYLTETHARSRLPNNFEDEVEAMGESDIP